MDEAFFKTSFISMNYCVRNSAFGGGIKKKAALRI